MTTLNISIPEALKEFVEERVAEGGYGSASDYLRDLLSDEQRRAQEKTDALLLEGMDSGPSTPMTAQDWVAIRQQVQARVSGSRDPE